jgi:uncharacterized linocin/CFP29 family protein
MPNDPQVPWTDEQWARVNQAIQEEASRSRVAATFLPLYGPLAPDTDFVRAEIIPDNPPLRIQDRDTIQLATLQVKVPVRSVQLADPELRSVLAVFRRAANVLARLEDAVIFRGLRANPPPYFTPPPGIPGLPLIWEIRGGQAWDGLLAPRGSSIVYVHVPPTPRPPALARPFGDCLVNAVSEAIGTLEGEGHFGPFAVVLDQEFFREAQTPNGFLVLPQDRIIPFLGGGPLLRSSTLPARSGVVVALGGAPVELVVAKDMSLQFLQVTDEPRYLFRVREKIALRIKEAKAIATLVEPGKTRIWSVSPGSGPSKGSEPASPYLVTIRGINLAFPIEVSFGGSVAEHWEVDQEGSSLVVALPRRDPKTPAHVPVYVEVTTQRFGKDQAEFTYVDPPPGGGPPGPPGPGGAAGRAGPAGVPGPAAPPGSAGPAPPTGGPRRRGRKR